MLICLDIKQYTEKESKLMNNSYYYYYYYLVNSDEMCPRLRLTHFYQKNLLQLFVLRR